MARRYDGESPACSRKICPTSSGLWYDAGGNLDQVRQEIKARFRRLVEERAARLAEHNLNSEVSIRDGNAGKVIVQEAKEWNADVIFVGSRGHVTLKRLLTGSVSHYVVDNASCPVEVVHQRHGEH